MRGRNSLRLHEEIMLLALRDREGTVFSGTMYAFAIGGASLAELLMEKRIDIDVVRRKHFVRVLDSTPIGDPVIDNCLSRIVRRQKRVQLRDWISNFAQTRTLKHRVAEELVRRSILRVDEDKVLGIFTRRIYPEIDPAPEREVIGRLREAIFGEGRNVDARTAVLLSLAWTTDLLKRVFDRKALRSRKTRLQQVVNGELIGQATREAIEALQAAVVVASVVAS